MPRVSSQVFPSKLRFARSESDIGALMQSPRIEEDVLKQAALFDRLFEQAPEGLVLLDVEDKVVRVNEEFTRLFGYTQEEAAGRLLNHLVVPEGVDDEASRTKMRA